VRNRLRILAKPRQSESPISWANKEGSTVDKTSSAGAQVPIRLSIFPKPIHRSKACGTLPQWKCAAFGALVGLVAGTTFGYLSQPDPLYRDTNTILGTLSECYDNAIKDFRSSLQSPSPQSAEGWRAPRPVATRTARVFQL
jgi:hypothetical protein